MTRLVSLPALLAALTLAGSMAAAQTADVGAALYADNCAACHGASGKGDGDMANVLTIPATNLALLSKENDGKFPLLSVIQTIDGRSGTRAHGGVMPLWGAVFSAEGAALGYGSEIEARGRLLSLALYLETLQAP